jgi:hypothetical protein
MPRPTRKSKVPRKLPNDKKNAELGSEVFTGKILSWHRQVVMDFEKAFGDQVHFWVSQAIFIKTGDGPGTGTLSWIGSPSNTIDLIGHLIRRLAKDGVENGGMTPEEAGTTLMQEIMKIAALDALYEKDVPKEPEAPPTGIIVPPKL